MCRDSVNGHDLARSPQSGLISETRLLVERALKPWSPANHELFPEATQRFAMQLLLIGQRLAALPDHAPHANLWLELVMAELINRGAN